ncbi:MAG TPA: hypothetical protein PLE77_08770 [Kiritimatiellia bacterium]|nr:hypothetical protein [Kiritimatiellia bacterium]
MKKHYLLPVKMAMMALLLAATAGLVGCELDDEDYDHNPPAGLGTMYIDNNTYDSLEIYVDAVKVGEVGDYDTHYFDLEPGTHRIVVQEEGGTASFRDDIDIVEGERTIVDVSYDSNDSSEYDVLVYID